MSEEKPARRFWQFHLSTVVLVVLTLGWVMLINRPAANEWGTFTEWGWPVTAYRVYLLRRLSGYGPGEMPGEYLRGDAVITDLLAAGLFLVYVPRIVMFLSSDPRQKVPGREKSSTRMLLMFVALILLWQNVGLYSFGYYGWPIPMFGYEFTYLDLTSGYHVSTTEGNFIRLALNLIFCGGILYAVAATNEKPILPANQALKARTYLVLILIGVFEVWWDRQYPLHYFFHSGSITPFIQRSFSITIEMYIARFVSENFESIWLRLS